MGSRCNITAADWIQNSGARPASSNRRFVTITVSGDLRDQYCHTGNDTNSRSRCTQLQAARRVRCELARARLSARGKQLHPPSPRDLSDGSPQTADYAATSSGASHLLLNAAFARRRCLVPLGPQQCRWACVLEVESLIGSQRALVSMSSVQPTTILMILRFCTRFCTTTTHPSERH
jgi:hypothetical protein